MKVGSGAFMKDLDSARRLAETMVRLGAAEGVPTTAVLSRMDTPLGRACGNALEVAEAIECLKGRGPGDLRELVTTLGGALLEELGQRRGAERIARAVAARPVSYTHLTLPTNSRV